MKHATIYITGLAGLLLSATAMADNTVIYGKINLALETVSAKGATDGHSNIPSGQRVTSNLSYLGFRGEENLGNGTSAVWQVEQDINPDNCNNCGFANRTSFVGLKGDDWGRLVVGRYDLYWTSHLAALDKHVVQAGVAGMILSVFGTYGGYTPLGKSSATTSLMGGRAINVVRYDTPRVNGLAGSLNYSTSEQKTGNGSPSAVQVELDYKDGPVIANLSYLHANSSNGSLTNTGGVASEPGMSADAVKFVGSYTFSQGTVLGLGGESLRTHYSEGNVSRMAYGMHLGQELTPHTYVGMTYGRAGNVSSSIAGSATTDKTDAHFLSLLTTYNFTKRTMVYAEYARIFNSANAGYYFVSTGNLNATAAMPAGKGADPMTFMVGMNHVF